MCMYAVCMHERRCGHVVQVSMAVWVMEGLVTRQNSIQLLALKTRYSTTRKYHTTLKNNAALVHDRFSTGKNYTVLIKHAVVCTTKIDTLPFQCMLYCIRCKYVSTTQQPLTTLHVNCVLCIHVRSQVITRLSVGTAFTLALTDAGELYGWGRNDAGQLGLGGGMAMDVYAMENLPRQVQTRHCTVSDNAYVSCAVWHSLTRNTPCSLPVLLLSLLLLLLL
jgi:Regulator of chromosome condensation (RCC1) repeat